MALTANREVSRYVDQELRSFAVVAAEHIWKGALVGVDRTTGCVRNIVAGDVFAGVAFEEADNNLGDDGAISIRLYTQGDFVLPVQNATAGHVGAAVYATANDMTDANPSAVGSSYCGILIELASSNEGVVRIAPMAGPQIERSAQVSLVSLTTAATTNPVMITQRTIRILSVQTCFNTVPDQGQLNVGTDPADPDEIVDAFNLPTLSAHTPRLLTLVGSIVQKNQRIWAKVSQATSVVGVGGVLTIRYVELP